jgi:uncharacterized Zn finger protein
MTEVILNMTRFKQRQDYEDFDLPSGEIYKLRCCDCGLVHDFVFVTKDGREINVSARRNTRSTAQSRRHLKGKLMFESIIDEWLENLMKKGTKKGGKGKGGGKGC